MEIDFRERSSIDFRDKFGSNMTAGQDEGTAQVIRIHKWDGRNIVATNADSELHQKITLISPEDTAKIQYAFPDDIKRILRTPLNYNATSTSYLVDTSGKHVGIIETNIPDEHSKVFSISGTSKRTSIPA
jgi:hypothetical protein